MKRDLNKGNKMEKSIKQAAKELENELFNMSEFFEFMIDSLDSNVSKSELRGFVQEAMFYSISETEWATESEENEEMAFGDACSELSEILTDRFLKVFATQIKMFLKN